MKVRPVWVYLTLMFVAALFGGMLRLGSRTRSLERRVFDLESKPCLLTGAHVGCEKRGAR